MCDYAIARTRCLAVVWGWFGVSVAVVVLWTVLLAGVAVGQEGGTACEGQPVPPSGFADVSGNTHEDAIRCIVWYGITQGVAPDHYDPSGQVTRAQMASFVARTMDTAGFVLPEPSDQGFGDVAGSTHADAINQLAAAGVVEGTSATTYAPADPVRRDQMASFLVRAYETMQAPLVTGPSGFTDIRGNVHEENIEKSAEAGFTQGTTATTYAPADAVRRDQMAAFLSRMLERLAADGRVTPPGVPEPLEFIDHGGQYWAVLWVGDDPALDAVREAIDERWGPVWMDGDIGCNRGAPEALGVDPQVRAVAVHFTTEADAREFAERAALPAGPRGTVQVTTVCLD